MGQRNDKNIIGNAVNDRLHFPPGTLGTGGKIQLLGNREIAVDGCKGVLEYDDALIRLNLGNRQLKIMGRQLTVRVLEKNYIEIEGFITGLEFI